MTKISTVLWDVGGVLLTNGWDHKERDVVLGHFGVDREAFEARHAAANDPWEKGLITADEYMQRTIFYEPRTFSPGDFIDMVKAQSKVLPDSGLRILRRLAASQELELGILNNESRELNDYRIRQFGLTEVVDCFFSSCYVGLRKPAPAIYRMALDVLQREPREVIFIDDRPENAAAASEVGMHGIRYQGSAQLTSELGQLGIAVAA